VEVSTDYRLVVKGGIAGVGTPSDLVARPSLPTKPVVTLSRLTGL
jgi:hypothetical protein